MHEHCSLPPSSRRYTLKDEALRFAAEARIARDDHKSLQAEKLQFAAFALDPDNKDLFKFGIIANEKLTMLFPYWFAALKKIVRHPQYLKPYENSGNNSQRILSRIFRKPYELPEALLHISVPGKADHRNGTNKTAIVLPNYIHLLPAFPN